MNKPTPRARWRGVVKAVKPDGIIGTMRKRRLRGRVGLTREAFDRSLAALPREHHGDAVGFLLRKSNRVSEIVLNAFPDLCETFTESVGETHVHVPDFDVSNPSPGAHSYALPGDQCEKVLDGAGGWLTEENVSYVTREVFDWGGLKSFIDSLTDEDSAESIAASLSKGQEVRRLTSA